jgi:arsenite-transporting ATPase
VPEIHVYEPALCCTTGVCGPDLDQRLVSFTADVAHVSGAGGQITRHNLASDPHAFVTDDTVRAFMHVAGSEGLPLTAVDGVTVLTGSYPTREQLIRFAALPVPAEGTPPAEGATARPALSLDLIGGTASACAPDSGCC